MADSDIVRLCRDSLLAYSIAQWQGYRPADHHRLIARALQRVEAGLCKRLMIAMPPRHGKSLLASENFPAWYIGKHPDRQIIACTYAQDFADDWGRKVRNQVRDPLFRSVFPGVTLATDSQAANKFKVMFNGRDDRGEYSTVGVGGPMTGRGAHCLPAGTVVQTDRGPMAIEDLESLVGAVRVLGYDHEGQRVQFGDLQAFRRREAPGLRRITTASGRVVAATDNHRVFARGEYVRADQLAAGDRLLCSVPSAEDEAGLPGGQGSEAGPRGLLLLSRLFGGASSGEEPPALREVCAAGGEEDAAVLRGLSTAQAGPTRGSSRAGCDLPAVQRVVHGGLARLRAVRAVLQQGLRRARALVPNVGGWQPEVEGRRYAWAAATALRASVPAHAAEDLGTGWLCLRGVRGGDEAARSPRRQQPNEQRGQQPDHAVRQGSSAPTRGAGFSAVADAVALVEHLHGATAVFDIQVGGVHNFFANGVLVHNCLLIDDPYKNREEADSETIRKKVKDWYTSTAYTRLMPNAAVVIIQTRWHEDDLSGWLLREHADEGWEVLELPAIDESDPEHPRALWPEAYPLHRLLEIKRAVGPRDWLALYQQKPRPDGGGEFKEEWIQYYSTVGRAHHLKKILLVDPASGKRKNKDNDYTSMWVIGLGSDENFYVLDLVRDRLNLVERTDKLFSLHRKWKPYEVRYEDYGLQADIEHIQSRMEADQNRFAILPCGGAIAKEQRIRRLIPAFNNRKVWFPREFWYTRADEQPVDLVREFIHDEFKAFPVGRHDDMMDALARLFEPTMPLKWPGGSRDEDEPAAVYGVLDETVGF